MQERKARKSFLIAEGGSSYEDSGTLKYPNTNLLVGPLVQISKLRVPEELNILL